MNFLLALFLSLPFAAFLNTIKPPKKKRRVSRKSKPEEQEAAAPEDTVETLLAKADGYFDQAKLDSEWNNKATGSDTTWRQRITAGINHWLTLKEIQPPTSVTGHDELKKKFVFVRTHRAFKTGSAASIIYRTVYGNEAEFDKDTTSGGLLKQCAGTEPYDDFILPMVRFLVHYFNIEDPSGGDLLTTAGILDENYGNWRKNLLSRSETYGHKNCTCDFPRLSGNIPQTFHSQLLLA